jgi:hypothetical protein
MIIYQQHMERERTHLNLTANSPCVILAQQFNIAAAKVPQSPDARGTTGEAGQSPALSRNCSNKVQRTC